MNGDPTKGIEDIVRRNVAALRSKANLTQQGLADEMLLRGITWTRETVAQVETTNRRLGFTEAIAVAACLDVPVARLTATGAATVTVGESEWSAAYLGAAIAGTAGDVFPPESYASPAERPAQAAAPEPLTPSSPVSPGAVGAPDQEVERRRGPFERRLVDPDDLERSGRQSNAPEPQTQAPQKTAERIERRMRLRVTASDVDATAQHLWSRSLESERERRVTDRHALTGGSLKTIRGHVSRDLDREIAHEMEHRPESATEGGDEGQMSPEEAIWEATRLNIILANKGYSDSDVTRWWNFTRHRELGDRTIAEAWSAGEYGSVSRLIESLPDSRGTAGRTLTDE
jgi:transcriptional regulator with XRE-family HTH domain